MLEIVDLGCERDGRTLFANISFVLAPGDVIQVKGNNGAGKTTLLRILAGLSKDYQGDLFWLNKELVKNYDEFRSCSYYIGHRLGLKTELTPVENLVWRHQISGRDMMLSISEALAEVNLHYYEDIPCYNLSAGQKRRVALAGLLTSQALLWILDEPFTSIDSEGSNWLGQAIKNHSLRQGMTLISSHQSLPQSIKNIKILNLVRYNGACYE